MAFKLRYRILSFPALWLPGYCHAPTWMITGDNIRSYIGSIWDGGDALFAWQRSPGVSLHDWNCPRSSVTVTSSKVHTEMSREQLYYCLSQAFEIPWGLSSLSLTSSAAGTTCPTTLKRIASQQCNVRGDLDRVTGAQIQILASTLLFAWCWELSKLPKNLSVGEVIIP
jgi:hypothetical protein